MIDRRLRAFTLMEVTIALLIAALLIGITYTAYSIIIKSYGSYTRKNQDMAVLVRLNEWLKKDFIRADTISKDTSGVVFYSPGHRVQYRFDPDFIIRSEFRADTFKVKAQAIITSFEAQPVTEFSPNMEQD